MPSALIIGASRGLGLGLAQEYTRRGWKITATVRSAGSPLHAAADPNIEIEQLDINEPDQLAALHERLKRRTFDLLFVNAGVMNGRAETIGTVTTDEFTRVLVTNALSPMRVLEALGDLVTANGTMAAMSSLLGSVARNTDGGSEVYRASKAALNTLMKSFAARQKKSQTFLAVHPGWVRTDMGGPNATLDIATSVRGMVDAISNRAGKTGVAFVDYANNDVAW